MAAWAALGRGKMALRKISKIMAASRLRLVAAAVRKAWIRIFSSPRRTGEAMPGLCLAMEAFRAPAMPPIEPIFFLAPPVPPPTHAQQGGIVVNDHDRPGLP